jgi:hypothetical protein
MTSFPKGRVPVEATLLVAASAVLLALRAVATSRVGFGDAEALYASYAQHPQPAYLDHPGLIGLLARAIGAGAAPSPERAHAVTSVLATLVPWAIALACRACGADWRRSATVGLVTALVPETAIGLFGMTPDLLLGLAWLSTLAFAAKGLGSQPGSSTSWATFAAAGLLAGIAAAAKVTGALLFAALLVTYASRPARAHARSLAPWAGLAAGAVVNVPVIDFEARTGWPMLAHRLIETQREAGLSLHNAAALLGGQIAYLSPIVAVLVAFAAREAWRGRRDAVGTMLLLTCALPLAALVPLCLWSPVAEPHWIAPALLSLGPAAARAPATPSRRLVVAACALAAAFVAIVHAWVLVPTAIRLAPASFDVRLDLASELYGWPRVLSAVRSEALSVWTPAARRGDVAVIGPHWVICAQLEAGLRGEIPVGCDTLIADDFDRWWPRSLWRSAEAIVWVTDTRFGPPPHLAAYSTTRTSHVRILRGGRVVRTFTVALMTRRAEG